MSITLLVWLSLFVGLSMMSFVRPIWGLAAYFLTYFASPMYWWWGKPIGDGRWALYGGFVLLASVLFSQKSRPTVENRVSVIRRIAIAMLVNATLVHFLLATNLTISEHEYTLFAKLVVLFLLVPAAIKSRDDLTIVMIILVLGAGYIGYEVTINDAGAMVKGRLEGVGAPQANAANELASLMVTLLPITGVLLFSDRRWHKLVAILVAPFIVNVVLLCNSRGAFLAAIASAVGFLAACPSRARKRAILIVALGGVAVFLLLGDENILRRFSTTFASEENRDQSAAGRLDYWKAGLRMVVDHPLGAGGHGFSKVHGPEYIASVSGDVFESRSVHNGYINDACEWGIQGLALRLGFFAVTLVILWRQSQACAAAHDAFGALLCGGLFAGTLAFMTTSMFGSHLQSEWGYWMGAFAVAVSSQLDGSMALQPEMASDGVAFTRPPLTHAREAAATADLL